MSDAGLDGRLAALAEAVELADGRLDAEPVEAARAVLARAGRRLGLGVEATVVALAGPTGAGKSTLFNALAGEELTTAGRRRPTTSAATAAIWGDPGGALLDWLEVPRRHRLDAAAGLDGLVLLDLPDFDSVERSHRLEVERVIELADLVVWVADPQKYADAALHDRYLRRLAAYAETMIVVLNQADLLAPDALAACQADLGRLLAADGLPGLPVYAVSARTGAGIDELRALLAKRVAAREAAVARLAADVNDRAGALDAGCGRDGGGKAGRVGESGSERLTAALGEAAGVPAVVAAVRRAHLRRGALNTGLPWVRWVRRARPDPLRRLHLDRGESAEATSLPAPTPVQRAQAATATRTLAGAAAGELADPWPGLVRAAATAHEDRLPGRLDAAVAGAELQMSRPRWWRLAGLLQLLFAGVALAGGLWLLALVGLGLLQIEEVLPVPEVEGIPIPTGLLLGGLLGGLLIALACRVLNGLGARRRAARARRTLHAGVREVAETDVLAPVAAELEARERLCAALATAASPSPPRRALRRSD